MSNSKENEVGSPSLNKGVSVFATDLTDEARATIIGIAQKAFSKTVNPGEKVYQSVADRIRKDSEKSLDNATKLAESASSGWHCVVGDHFGSSVTHRLKTYM